MTTIPWLHRGKRVRVMGCGPNAMLDAVETALVKIGVPADRVHSERLDWV